MVCPEERYIEKAEFLRLFSHILSVFSIIVNSFGVYIIHFKTPFKMSTLKRVILVTHLCGTINDLLHGSLVIPYVFTPTLAASSLGILNYIRVPQLIQHFITMLGVTQYASSVVLVFENRHNVIVSNNLRLKNHWMRSVFYAILAILPFIKTCIIFSKVPEQENTKSSVEQILHCPTTEFHSLPIFIVLEDPAMVGSVWLFTSVFYMTTCLIFVIHTIYHLSKISSNISKRRKEMEKQFFIAVCIQVAVPLMVLCAPMAYFSFSIKHLYYNQGVNNLLILLTSIHGSIATLVLLMVYDGYRTEVLRRFGFYKTISYKVKPHSSMDIPES